MTSARTRAAVGGIGAVLWLVGTTAATPLIDMHPLFVIAQIAIDASPGAVATAAIETFGKSAQPLLVAGIAAGILAFGASLGAVWGRLSLPSNRVALAGFVLAATAGFFLLAGVTSPPTLAAVTALGTVPVVVFAVLVGRDDWSPLGERPAGGRRLVLQSAGLALAGAAGVAGVSRTLAPEPESDAGGTEPLPDPETPEPDAEGTPTRTATPKRDLGTTVTAQVTPTPTPSPTPTPEVLRKDRFGEIRVTELEGGGSFGFDFIGMPRRVTPPEGHYVIDKNLDDPEIDPEGWTLSVGGAAAENSYDLSFDELVGHEESVEEVVTMLCISNEVGGGLVSTGRWRGVPLKALIEEAGPTDEARDIVTKSPDGYSEGIPWEYVRDHSEVLLAYGLGGETLSVEHGAPARLLIPGRYGMKSTKWVTEIEISNGDHEGYWEERGWEEEAVVHMFSYIRALQRRGSRLAVGGVAYAGLAGVQSVEVSLDGGETWTEAELEDPPDEHAWRRWRHVVERQPGTVDVVTRAIDGNGKRQTSEKSPPHPGGSTGWHQQSFEI